MLALEDLQEVSPAMVELQEVSPAMVEEAAEADET